MQIVSSRNEAKNMNHQFDSPRERSRSLIICRQPAALSWGKLTKSLAQSVNQRGRPKQRGSGFICVSVVVLGLSAAAAVNAAPFFATGPMSTPREGHTATLLPNGKVLVAGGYSNTDDVSSAELYDPATGLWTTTGAMNTQRSYHTATLLPNGRVLVAGGDATAELYDPASGTWTVTGLLDDARTAHTATLLPNGKVLVTGGYGATGDLSSAELYDPASATWTATGPMTTPRSSHTATVLPNGQVLIAGGDWSASDNTAELYDPASGTFTATGELSAFHTEHTATLLPSGLVLVTGGERFDFFFGNISLRAAELYDPVTGTWTDTAPILKGRTGHTATLLSNGLVLVTGGLNRRGGYPSVILADGELYDPAAGTWSSAGNMSTNRLYHTATLLATGQVLITGGYDGYVSDTDQNSADRYDPNSGAWVVTGSLLNARLDQTATLLTNGQVLVAGGWNGFGPITVSVGYLSSSELYDPTSRTWEATGNLNSQRRHHTATLLPNGLVLAVGGTDGIGFPPDTELYDPSVGSWTYTGPLVESRALHSATLLTNGQVLVAGGIGGTSPYTNVTLSTCELYDRDAAAWSGTSSMHTSRQSHSATLLADGRVLVAGGRSSTNMLPSAEVYDPLGRNWTVTGSMDVARLNHTATLLINGKVLIVGGQAGTNAIAVAELYDPATQTWTVTGSMAIGRFSHTATLLANGKVLVAGGSNLPGTLNSLSSAELYDPASGRWTPAAPFTNARRGHTAVLLANGQVLAAGGDNLDSFPQYFASAELFVYGTGPVPVPQPTRLTNPKVLADGSFQFSFTNAPGAVFNVLATTNLVLPLGNWTVLNGVTEILPGQFQFTDHQATNYARRFYRLRSHNPALRLVH